LGTSDSAHDYIGKLFRVTLIACALLVIAFVFFPSVYRQFPSISLLSTDGIAALGVAILIFALVWVLTAQRHMQASWRIGIDEHVRTELVQRGLFRFSRNPIFLGMRLMLAGLFLVLPNAVMLVIWMVGEILMQIQVRLEEEYLNRTHGETYQTYQKQVRRWI
jgi:protein-S-isoprenylcysteine O-methyltransferase Ste14